MVDRQVVPDPGGDQEPKGRPTQTTEGLGDLSRGTFTELANGGQQSEHDELTTHPYRGGEHVQGESNDAEARGELQLFCRGEQDPAHLLGLPVGFAFLREGDRPFQGVGT